MDDEATPLDGTADIAHSNKAPARYVHWINAHLGFNPRAGKNSNALSKYIVDDLRYASPKALDVLIDSGALIAVLNANVPVGAAGITVRNIDLVLRTNEEKLTIQLAVENKTVMTSHGKARKNRYGDIIAYANHMHSHKLDCVTGAAIVVNTSEAYENPDSFAKGLVRKKFNMEKVLRDTLSLYGSIPLRNAPTDPTELPEALTVIMVQYDGVNPATLVEGAPDPSSPLHYDNFIRRLVEKYHERFCQEGPRGIRTR